MFNFTEHFFHFYILLSTTENVLDFARQFLKVDILRKITYIRRDWSLQQVAIFVKKWDKSQGPNFWPLQTGLNSLDKTLRLVPQNRLNCLWNKFSRPSMISRSQNSKFLSTES